MSVLRLRIGILNLKLLLDRSLCQDVLVIDCIRKVYLIF